MGVKSPPVLLTIVATGKLYFFVFCYCCKKQNKTNRQTFIMFSPHLLCSNRKSLSDLFL